MAPLPVFTQPPTPAPLGVGDEYGFPRSPGMSIAIPHPSPPTPVPVGAGAGAPNVDDVFVVVVSIAVVASLTAFVVVQAIAALREMLEKPAASTSFCSIPIATFRKHGLLSFNSKAGERDPLLSSSLVSIDSQGCRRYSRWVGQNRCKFTLSPERYDSDTSSTLTRSISTSSTDSTVVGGRVCVVYDDTIEPSEEEREADEQGSTEEDEDGEGCENMTEEDKLGDQCRRVPLRSHREPRSRVRRPALFIV